MLFGRVRGTAVASVKYQDLTGMKLMVIEPLNKHLEPTGPLQVAVDVVQAGPGDLCVMVRSREAALAMDIHTFVPVDLALIGDELVVHPDDQFDVTLKKGSVKYT